MIRSLIVVILILAALAVFFYFQKPTILTPDAGIVAQPLPTTDQQKLQPPETPVPTTPIPVKVTNSGIEGNITIWPNKPRCQSGVPCSNPYQGTVLVKSADGSLTITQFTANSDGTFKVNLPAGQYLLTGINTGLPPTLMPQKVTVENNKYTAVSLQFDSGMR